MNYKKIEKDKYTLHLINTTRFKTINIEIYFSNLYNRKDRIYYTFLSSLLSKTTKKYNTRLKMNIKKEQLYGLGLSYSYFTIGKMQSFMTNITFLNPKYVAEKLYDNVFSFLKEAFFNPNVINNKFDEKEYNFTLDGILTSIKRNKCNNNSYALEQFRKNFFDKTILKDAFYEKESVYKKINNEDVYTFYKNMFSNNKIDIFVLGEFDEELIIKKINNLFKNINNTINFNIDLYINNKIKDKVKEVKESKDYKQSIIMVGYKFKKLTDYESKYILPIYNLMLGGTSINNSILFTNVREKNSLCYYIASYAYRYSSSIVIESLINKNNYDKVLNLIKNNIIMSKNTPNINDLFISSKKTLNIGLNDYYDNPYKIIERYFLSLYDNISTIEEAREIINNIDINDVFKLSEKLILDTIYFLEGNKNEGK